MFLQNRILFLLLVLPFGLVAQSPADTTEVTSDITLNEVVINSDIFESKYQDFAGSVTSIKPDLLHSLNSLSLQPLLNTVPGVYMQSGALNTNRITIRGIGSRSPFATNKIKAYLDEIPLSTGEGETTLEDIDFSTLAGVEVYRGPASTTYGAGLGGAVHMLTSRSTPENNGSIDFSVGSFGLKKYNATVGIGGEKAGMNLFYQDVQSDGYRDNNEYSRQSLSSIGRAKVGNKSSMSSYFNVTNLKAFIPSSVDEDTYHSSPTNAGGPWGSARGFEDNKRVRAGLSLSTAFNEGFESTVALFTNIGDSREVTPFGNEDISTSNFGLRGKLRKSFLPENKLVGVLGTEVFVENFRIKSFENDNSQNGDMTSDLRQDRNYANVFLATEYLPTKDWILSLGGNINLSKYENTNKFTQGGAGLSGKKNFDPVISPKLSVIRHLGGPISIYGLVAHGFSLPTFDETLNPGGNINEDIQVEKGMNYELGIKGKLFNNRIYFDLTGYTMRINDLLVARRNSELDYSGFNAGKSTHNGLEVMLKHLLITSGAVTINHDLSYTLMDYSFDKFIDDDRGDFSGNKLTGVPDHTVNYNLTIETAYGFYGRVNWQGAGKMPILDDNTVFSDSYLIANLKLGFRREFQKVSINIYGGVNNVFDEKYASMLQINPRFNNRYYYPGLPVNYYSGIKVGYRF